MLERRKSNRGRTFLGGSIAPHRTSVVLDCLVRNLSPEGAKLAVNGAIALPDEFDLTISRRPGTFRARTVWRQPDAAGVSFLEAVDERSTDANSLARRLRRAEAERARLRQQIARMTSLD